MKKLFEFAGTGIYVAPRGFIFRESVAMGSGSSAGEKSKIVLECDDEDEEGICDPVRFVPHADVIGQGPEAVKLFRKLGIKSPSVNSFYGVFQAIDVDGSNSIDLKEFFDFFGLESTELTRRAFSIFDEDDSGTIDFCEFVVSTWNFCTMDDKRMTTFTFKLFDVDDSRFLDREEIQFMVTEACEQEKFSARRKRLILAEAIPKGARGVITLDEFRTFAAKHPVVNKPAMRLQAKLRRFVLGEEWWLDQKEARDGTIKKMKKKHYRDEVHNIKLKLGLKKGRVKADSKIVEDSVSAILKLGEDTKFDRPSAASIALKAKLPKTNSIKKRPKKYAVDSSDAGALDSELDAAYRRVSVIRQFQRVVGSKSSAALPSTVTGASSSSNMKGRRRTTDGGSDRRRRAAQGKKKQRRRKTSDDDDAVNKEAASNLASSSSHAPSKPPKERSERRRRRKSKSSGDLDDEIRKLLDERQKSKNKAEAWEKYHGRRHTYSASMHDYDELASLALSKDASSKNQKHPSSKRRRSTIQKLEKELSKMNT